MLALEEDKQEERRQVREDVIAAAGEEEGQGTGTGSKEIEE